ncbi:MAG: hypothetical protein WCV67_18735 [Victivallaceae bacterium]|jgi:hypothetical protein
MKKNLLMLLNIVVLFLFATTVFLMISYIYNLSPFFRGLFEGTNGAAASGTAASGSTTVGLDPELAMFYSKLSFYIFSSIIVIQFTALFVAFRVFRGLKLSKECVELKLKKIENADIFLDLPLYIGLFGTVSSFIVMTFNPQISRLIAYSATLIGIIFSVVLRVALQFPLRQQLLDAANENKKTSGDK